MFLANAFFDGIWLFMREQAIKLIATAIIIFITLLIIFTTSSIIRRYIKKEQNKRKRAVTLANVISNLIKYILIIISIIVVLSVWGVNVTSILVGAGIVTLAVTFGAQKFIADILSGISLVFENYFDIDDVIEVHGFKGRVFEIGLKSTKIINWRNEIKIISNSEIVNITNFSRAPSVGVVEIKVAYTENIEKVMTLLDEKLVIIKEQFPQIVEGPNVIGVVSLVDNGYMVRVTVKTTSEQHYAVERGIRKYVKELFEDEKVEIPLPKVVVINGHSDN